MCSRGCHSLAAGQGHGGNDSQQAADHAENDAREACTPGSHEQHAKGVLLEALANLGWEVPLYKVPA